MKSESSMALPAWPDGYILEDKYEVVKHLVTTNRCEIYKVKELQPPYHVFIVKRLLTNLPKEEAEDAHRRFEREIVALRLISHRLVLRIYESKTTGENRYFVTEFADKGSLRNYLDDKPDHKLTPIEALEIAAQICQGLDAAHRQRIIHRDVKPGNILLFSERDGSTVAKLADFSIALVPDDLSGGLHTQTGWEPCTPPYASPEQLEGKKADILSDLHSWAIVFFEMLTGENPADSLKDPDSYPRYSPTFDEYPLSFFTERGIPRELAEVLQRALSKDRQLRQRSAQEVRGALESIKSQVIAEIPTQLGLGEAHIKAQDWQNAKAAFERGLALCEWFGEPHELLDLIKEFNHELLMGRWCAQGMFDLAERQWLAAAQSLEQLRDLDPQYLGIDIDSQLRVAQSELQLQRKYQLILQYKEREAWTPILQLAADLTTAYRGRAGDESIGEIRKLAMYARGKKRLEEHELGSAYHQFHRLYLEDPGYEDVAELCAAVAYQNAMRQDIPASCKHQVEWLEKVVDIDPDYRERRAGEELGAARYCLAKELLDKDKYAAVAQLEKISPDYSQWTEVYPLLVDTYYQLFRQGNYDIAEHVNPDAEAEARYRLGVERWQAGDLQGAVEQLTEVYPKAKEFDNARSTLAQIYVALGLQERKDRRWHRAMEWWDQALALSPSLESALRWRYREAKVRDRIKYYEVLALVGILLAFVAAIPVCSMLLGLVVGAATATPTPTPSTVRATVPILITPPFTATPSATSSPSPTLTRTPSPTSTLTPTATHTPTTRRPTNTHTFTPTPTVTPTPTPTEGQPPPTPPPTPPTPPSPSPTAPPPPGQAHVLP